MNQIIQYGSLHEFYQSIGVHLEEGTECTVHSIAELHNDLPFTSKIFRANYYSLVVVKDGDGLYKLDGKAYPIKKRTVYYTNPGHMKGFEIHNPIDAWLITFSEKFIADYCAGLKLQDVLYLLAEVVPPWYPVEEEFLSLYATGKLMCETYQTPSESRFSILGALLSALLLKIKDLRYRDYEPSNDDLIQKVFQSHLNDYFLGLVSGKHSKIPQVQVLAKYMDLHPNYLSTVIREKTGKTVNAWISERAIAEAQVQLSSSTTSVQKIAETMGFSEATHFSKYFKKHSGLTPKQYRAQKQQ